VAECPATGGYQSEDFESGSGSPGSDRTGLLINNYLPSLINAGYMEAFMDWWLIYRTEAELLA
jgi:hypothetical protein